MPVVAPIIGGAIAAGGSIGAAALGQSSADKQSQLAAQQAAAAQAQAQKNAQAAINSADANAARGAIGQQQAFANAILTPGLFQGQQALTGQLQQAAAGQGPNPALQQLANTTGQNVANQAALMAGQRGAGANAGLMARQIAQQGAATQQQAVGQGAALAAQQQIAAREQLLQQLASQQGMGLSAQQAATQAALGQQGITTGALMGASQQGTNAAQQAMGISGAAGQQAAGFGQQALGAGLGAAGSVLSTAFAPRGNDIAAPGAGSNETLITAAEGGVIRQPYAPGGQVHQMPAPKGPRSFVGQHLAGMRTQMPAVAQAKQAAPEMMAKGGKVPALLSPGEKYLSPKDVKKVEKGANPMEVGKKVPGKPKVGGAKNSYKNDTVKATLEEGGIVLPRSVTQSKHPHWEAHKFVKAIMAKKGMGLK